jgi:signal transduction histidine kinase
MNIYAFLATQPKYRIFLVGLVVTILIGYLDYLTGPELAFSLFYLIPVIFVAWYVRFGAGLTIDFLAGLAWLSSDVLINIQTNHFITRPLIPYWNAVVGLLSFLVVTWIIVRLKRALEEQQQTIQFVVHDLRAPLTGVITGLQTLQSIVDNTLAPDGKELIDIALSSGTQMNGLINTLLDTSRLENHRWPLQMQQVEVQKLIHLGLSPLALWARDREVALVDAAKAGLTVYADTELASRVLMNLTNNALKYSPKGASITVDAQPTDGQVLFSVADQGPGIPEEWRKRIFERYVQIQARQAGVPVGTGLGLTFVRLAVEAQGGRIWIESTVGQGTTVYFTLPAGG